MVLKWLLLLASRWISDGQTLSIKRPGKRGQDEICSSPCLSSDWAMNFRKIKIFLKPACCFIMMVLILETLCFHCPYHHKGLRTYNGNQRQDCHFTGCVRTEYINVPDFYLNGSLKQVSLSWSQLVAPTRSSLIHTTSWTMTVHERILLTGAIPLVNIYQGGGSAAIEPLMNTICRV